MSFHCGLLLLVALLLSACQPGFPPPVTIIDNERIVTLQTEERVPSALLAQAGIKLAPEDRLLVNGIQASPDTPVTRRPITLQVRRATSLTLLTPDGEKKILTSAYTVGEALAEASVWLRAGDETDLPLDMPIPHSPVTLSLSLLRELTVTMNGSTLPISSSAGTVGEALAEAGIPLLGLDYSVPAAWEPLPADGLIRVVRVSESVLLAQKPIPYESDFQASAEVPLDQTQILQPGETGLAVQRIRIRYEDGKEVARLTENETLVRPPRTRILGYGTKVEIQKTVVDGVEIEYWRAVQMYASSYSPCRSGVDRCYPGTASGKSVRKGVVAMRYDWYLAMGGQPLYIPGYGFATVEDVCGGCTGRPWIDLGYSDSDWQHWSSWVTVYFLTPVPANIIYVLE